MGLELTYDNFFSLSIGFFLAFAGVRATHELGSRFGFLRRLRRRQAVCR